MSYADLLRKFAERSVTSVTPPDTPEVTGKKPSNQSSNPSYPGNPEKPREAGKTRFSAELVISSVCSELKLCAGRFQTLLSGDDLRDIANGETTKEQLTEYAKQMLADGHDIRSASISDFVHGNTDRVPDIARLPQKIRSMDLPLLPDDIRYLELILMTIPKASHDDLLSEYRTIWAKTAAGEPSVNRKDGVARRAANTWIRETVLHLRMQAA